MNDVQKFNGCPRNELYKYGTENFHEQSGVMLVGKTERQKLEAVIDSPLHDLSGG